MGLVAYRAAVAKDPEMSAAWFAIGRAEYRKENVLKVFGMFFVRRNGKSTEAEIDAYERCVKLDPKHAIAHYNLGVALQEAREDFDQAEAMYRKVIELYPKHTWAHLKLGILLHTVREDFDQAEPMYRKVIELNPKHACAHCNLGNGLHDVRYDFDQAEAMYRKAIELDPTPSPSWVHWNLSLLLEARANS